MAVVEVRSHLPSWPTADFTRTEPRRPSPIAGTRQDKSATITTITAMTTTNTLSNNTCFDIFQPARRSLPTIRLHAPMCRCAQAEADRHAQDEALAHRILSAADLYRARRKATTDSWASYRRTRSSTGGMPAFVHAVTRLLDLATTPTPPAPSLPAMADLCNGCAMLDLPRVARYLLDTDARRSEVHINGRNHLGATPLMAVVRSPAARQRPRAQAAMVRLLLDLGADPNGMLSAAQGRASASVLSMACEAGASEVVRILLDRGAAVDARLPTTGRPAAKQRGQTALHVAVLAERPECLEVLAGHGGADVDAVFDGGAEWTLGAEEADTSNAKDTHHIKENRRRKGAKGGAGSNTAGSGNLVSALHLAHDSYGCTAVLLRHGADVSARDGRGRTPLHWAAEAGNAEVVRALLGAGAAADAAGRDGATPLAVMVARLECGAPRQGYADVARMLLCGGADPSRRYLTSGAPVPSNRSVNGQQQQQHGGAPVGKTLGERLRGLDRWKSQLEPILEEFETELFERKVM